MTTETVCPQCHNPLFDARDDADSHRICILCGWRTRNYVPEYINDKVHYTKDPESPRRNEFPRTTAGQVEYRKAVDLHWRIKQATKKAAMDIGETKPRLKEA